MRRMNVSAKTNLQHIATLLDTPADRLPQNEEDLQRHNLELALTDIGDDARERAHHYPADTVVPEGGE